MDRHPIRVSIVTPVFNGAAYIAETVESVLGQDCPGLEYIVVDDGSRDDTLVRLAPYSGRLRVISQANSGEAAAVNAGVATARGAILGIVNADDPLLPGHLEACLARLDAEPGLQGVYPDWLKIDAQGLVMERVQALDWDYRVLLAQHFCMIGPGCLFRHSGLHGQPPRDPGLRYTGDYHQWLRMGLTGPFAHITKTLATWRCHDAGASQAGRNPEMARNKIDAVRVILDHPNLPEFVTRLRGEALSTAYYIAAVLGLHDPRVPARAYMLRSLRHAWRWPGDRIPERRRSWRLVAFALGLPLTRPLAELYRRARPERFQVPAGGVHYRDWRGGLTGQPPSPGPQDALRHRVE